MTNTSPPQRKSPLDDRTASGRAADAVDFHVGSRVRLARKTLDMTQEALAEQLGVTFQQLQKYEKGINRISAGRLHHAARILGVPVSFFFPEGEAMPAAEAGHEQPLATLDFLSTADGIELNRAFSQIEDPAVRQRVIDLVRSLATSSAPVEAGGGSRRAEAGTKAGRGRSSTPLRRKRLTRRGT